MTALWTNYDPFYDLIIATLSASLWPHYEPIIAFYDACNYTDDDEEDDDDEDDDDEDESPWCIKSRIRYDWDDADVDACDGIINRVTPPCIKSSPGSCADPDPSPGPGAESQNGSGRPWHNPCAVTIR